MNRLFITAFLSVTITTPAVAARYVSASSAPAPATPTRTVIAAASAPTPTPAPAPTPIVPVRASTPSNSGMYIGAQLGDSSVGMLLGYQLSKMFSMEISYDYVDPVYTTITSQTTTLKRSRAGASGIAMFPIKFNEMGPMAIYIKVGYGRATEQTTVEDSGLGGLPATTTVTTISTTGVTGGAGVHVDLTSSSSARLGFNVVGSDRTAYLAAMYKF